MEKFTMSFALEDKSIHSTCIGRELIVFSFGEEHLDLKDVDCPKDYVVTGLIGYHTGTYRNTQSRDRDIITFGFTHVRIASLKNDVLIDASDRWLTMEALFANSTLSSLGKLPFICNVLKKYFKRTDMNGKTVYDPTDGVLYVELDGVERSFNGLMLPTASRDLENLLFNDNYNLRILK